MTTLIWKLRNVTSVMLNHVVKIIFRILFHTTGRFFLKNHQLGFVNKCKYVYRLANIVAKRHLNMNVDSQLYIKPAMAYIQELMSLASEKGFIMSRINARELSNKLSDSINNGLIAPLLKVS